MNDGLKAYAAQRGIQIGTCASAEALQSDPVYAQTLVREFNLLTPENALKFGPLCPSRNVYDFEAADALVDFAEANGMKVRGHVLVWDHQLPGWLTTGNFSRSELIEILTDHITVVVGRYQGRITVWDVVNEAINEQGKFRENIWYKTIGPDYIDIAFNAAHATDPQALLFYNDFGAEGTQKHQDGVYELLCDLLQNKVPVHGVGLQMHLHLSDLSSVINYTPNLKRLGTLGLHIHITELDVRMPLNGLLEDQLRTQAYIYEHIVKLYLSEPNCNTIILWGFTDRYAWIPYFFPGDGSAMILDEKYSRKPSYQAVANQLSSLSF